MIRVGVNTYHTYKSIYPSIYTHTYMYIHTFIHTCPCSYMQTYNYIHMHTSMYIYAHMHTYMYLIRTYTHRYMYVHAHISTFSYQNIHDRLILTSILKSFLHKIIKPMYHQILLLAWFPWLCILIKQNFYSIEVLYPCITFLNPNCTCTNISIHLKHASYWPHSCLNWNKK